jgi:2-keto-4-pentenoate hydratase
MMEFNVSDQETKLHFDVEQAASLLVQAHVEKRQVRVFEPGPADPEQAYAVQDAVTRRLGPVSGWKVGAKAPAATPNAAPILSDLIRSSPATWPSSSFHMRGIEAEIAFRIARDLKPRPEPMTEQEVYDAVGSVHAGIEIVDTRLVEWSNADRLWVLADNQSNGGFVFDPVGSPWRGDDYSGAPVRLSVNGYPLIERDGGNPAGDPRWLLVWLVNHCVQSRGGLRAGTIVTTGSYTGMTFVDPGVTVDAEFPGIGSARASFT